MIFQVMPTPSSGIRTFDLIQYVFIFLLIVMIINSVKQKFRHTIKITLLIFVVVYVIFPLIFYGQPLLLLHFANISPGYIDLFFGEILPISSYYSMLFYVIYYPIVTLFVVILSSIYSNKKKKILKHIRAPSLIKSFPIDRELIFISYATVDSDFYQIPKLTRILTNYPEINEILYWESDMKDDIYKFMDENLKQCKVVLLFCSKNSLYSEAVKMEWRSALKLEKKIIPIFVEPDDIPALLSTKLGIQFKESDPYTSIEDIYQMVLKKLEVRSFREFTRFIIPKWITEQDFEEQNFDTIEKSIVFDSDISSKELGKNIAFILQDSNFFVPGLQNVGDSKKKKDKIVVTDAKDLNQFNCFAELKDDPEDIALSVRFQRISENLTKVFIKARGKRDWVLNEILKDINQQMIDFKSTNELLRDNLEKIASLLSQIGDVKKFLRKNLGPDIKQVENLISQYNEEMIEKEDFIVKGTQLAGKKFITVFIKNIPLILKESKKVQTKKTPLQFSS